MSGFIRPLHPKHRAGFTLSRHAELSPNRRPGFTLNRRAGLDPASTAGSMLLTWIPGQAREDGGGCFRTKPDRELP